MPRRVAGGNRGSLSLDASVIGCGYMGGGIAQVLAIAGATVRLADSSPDVAHAARSWLVLQAAAFEDAQLFPAGAADLVSDNLVAAASVEEAVANATFVAEAIPEDLSLKQQVLARISAAMPPDAVLGSNTSAIPISLLAQSVDRPRRFLGVHWMNPAPFVPGVEVIPGTLTDDEVVAATIEILTAAGKVPTRVADAPGFVANRLQFALYQEACFMVDEGLATPEEIDTVVANSFGFRLALFGPFAIADMAGLDVYASAYGTLERAFGSRFAVPALLKEAVAAGKTGVKNGGGILSIAAQDIGMLLDYRDHAYAQLGQLRRNIGPAPGL